MSRPTWSVPSQYSLDGLKRMSWKRLREGFVVRGQEGCQQRDDHDDEEVDAADHGDLVPCQSSLDTLTCGHAHPRTRTFGLSHA